MSDPRDLYLKRFLAACAAFDPAHPEPGFLYYAKGDAWVATDYVQCFTGLDGSLLRVFGSSLLVSRPDDEDEEAAPITKDAFHQERCVEMGGRFFVSIV